MTTYQSDFYSWTQQQASLLKARQFNELDFDNLIEEIETMGRSEKHALESRLAVLLQHLLKWKYQPERRGRSWQLTLKEQRIKLAKLLKINSGLKNELDEILTDAYQLAVVKAAKETRFDETVFPTECPWQLIQITHTDFYPD
jgi:Domain of unknown function DUF29